MIDKNTLAKYKLQYASSNLNHIKISNEVAVTVQSKIFLISVKKGVLLYILNETLLINSVESVKI
jgi:hypothetical protein